MLGQDSAGLMEQCLGDWQFVTLLLYLDDICIFAQDVSAMLDRMELVFSWLKLFNLKIKPKNLTSFRLVWSFWVMSCQLMEFLPTQKR